MVATSSGAQRSSRAVAVALVALLLVVIAPTPTAISQGTAVRDVWVAEGSAQFFQDNFKSGQSPTHFIDDGRGESTLKVPVRNTHSTAIANVPVYFYNEDKTISGCQYVDLPGATEEGDGVAVATFTFTTRNMVDGPHLFEIEVFRPKPTGINAACPDKPVSLPASQDTTTRCVQERTNTTCTPDADPNNNRAYAYFAKNQFLNLQIKSISWCENGRGQATCDSDMLTGSGAAYNVTPTGQTTVNTFFEIEVENVGGHVGMVDRSKGRPGLGPCNTCGFEYTLNVTLVGPNGEQVWLTTLTNTSSRTVVGADPPTHRARSLNFELNSRAGEYNVTVRLDPTGALRKHGDDTAPDVGWQDVEVGYRDFTAWFHPGDFRTSQQNPYPHDAGLFIHGNVTFANNGTTGRVGTIPYRIYIGDPDPSAPFALHGNFAPAGHRNSGTNGENSVTVPISWEYTNNPSAPRYLRPGRHTIVAEIDPTDALLESNETNNRVELHIFVEDKINPKVTSVRIAPAGTVGGGAADTFRPYEGFNVFAIVEDDDAALTVRANFTLASNTSVYRVLSPLSNEPDVTGEYGFQNFTFGYHNFSARAPGGWENWTYVIEVNDSSGRLGKSEPQNFRLVPWPIHTVDAATLIRQPAYPDDVYDWASGPDPRWEIRVQPEQTGFDGEVYAHQQMHTENLALNLTTLQGTINHSSERWIAQSNPQDCPPKPPRPVVTCVGQSAELNNTFATGVAKDQDEAGPGLWNWTVRIKDISGLERVVNGTLLIRDAPPAIDYSDINLSSVVPSEAAFTSVNITGNFSDDSNRVKDVWVNFTRFEPSDNVRVNLSVPRVNNGALENGQAWFNHTLHMEVGRGKMFGLGGKFNTRLEVQDAAGNWNFADLGVFEVRDIDPPRIQDYGAVPSPAQAGENVTFYATANDATNVTMRFEVFRSSTVGELLFDAVLVNQSEGSNYTFTANFSAEAIHAWRVTAIDGTNRSGDPRVGSLLVRNNLGPRYEIRSPSTVIDGTRYGAGTPRVEILVSDIEGVQLTSIDLRVADQRVDFEVVPAPANLTGYLVVCEGRCAKRFAHRDVVNVSISARDTSPETLESNMTFSFVVDDLAPTARILSITPSYRDQPAHVLNVSVATRFSLAAEDLDGLPTEVPVGGIRYRILGGGPGAAETVYTGPFRISDATGVYTGPRIYRIEYWAEDAVGNFNRTPNSLSVFVDDTPPALFQFFPQGRSVNATFVDDRVGVERGVAWYRLNDQPFVPASLAEREGAWSVLLPEGVKGDRMCYYLQAWDRLNNTETFGNATNPYACFDVSNHEPRVRITSPVDGSRISRSVELRWEASDEDGDALVYTVYIKAPGRPSFAELVKIENTAVQRYTIDTTRYADGQYTFRVAAGDGGFVKLAETTVTILNRVDAVGVVSVVGNPLPGETLLIKAEVTKAEALVEARLYLGSKLVDSWSMNDEGREGDEAANDGIYSVRVPVSAAGDYRVEIFTRYQEDGETRESTLSSAATFSAKFTPTYILSNYGAIIALIGLLAAVGIGVAVFVVMRRR